MTELPNFHVCHKCRIYVKKNGMNFECPNCSKVLDSYYMADDFPIDSYDRKQLDGSDPVTVKFGEDVEAEV
jgi:Zn finger protein HypA/HybF involved in hydrogenase expression